MKVAETTSSALAPYIVVYVDVEGENSGDRSFSPEDKNILTRISADSVVILRIQEEDSDDAKSIRLERTNSIAARELGFDPEAAWSGFLEHSMNLAFDNFLNEKITVRSVYSASQFIADALNMLGIFLGLSVFAILIVPATSILIRRRTRGLKQAS